VGVPGAKCGSQHEKNGAPLQPTNRTVIGGNDSILIIAQADNRLASKLRLQRAHWRRSGSSL